MEAFSLHIAHVYWGEEGKRRPVLIFSQREDKVTVFKITTQYQHKSETVRRNLFEITDWKSSGLSKPSFIDIGGLIVMPMALVGAYPIGKLSDKDKARLEKLLTERQHAD